MKKLLSFAAVLSLVCVGLFVGCKKADMATPAPDTTATNAPATPPPATTNAPTAPAPAQ